MDIADQSTELEELHLKVALSKHASYTIDPGLPGECEWCGEFSERIVLACVLVASQMHASAKAKRKEITQARQISCRSTARSSATVDRRTMVANNVTEE